MPASFQSIPVLDYSLALGPEKPVFLSQLRHALMNVGFLYLTNTSVPNSLVDQVREMSPKFFDLSQEKKDALGMVHSPHFMGYSRFATQMTKGIVDQREQFEFCVPYECRWKEGDPLYMRVWGPCQWPAEEDVPNFQHVFTEYGLAISRLSTHFLELICESVGLAPNALDPFLKDTVEPCHRGKIAKYPDTVPGSDSDNGVAPHFDPDFLTFLMQVTDQPGLQVQNQDGDWIPAPPIPYSWVVNIGRALNTVTKNVVLATSHKALLPPPGTGARYSIPFLQGLNPHIRLSDYELDFPPEIIALRDARDGNNIDSANYAEFETSCAGEANLVGRVKTHPEVAERFYPEYFAKYFPNGMPVQASAY
ncbi:Clavaminate synthase-like protein [Sistotremastrum niveocremeum HHB9708]|uniref:Clavaminate synthase-like protein n=2 Tax=Sistotremastraceae TaxID=3402574 RepID=A0A164TCC1_9AGAM|nr:Clavaminate synthase-like protein [Sistotremastrum niveocremeum HHB9708]KZT39478.1 Clavaminate synthase-like protein [Sistotremastrum suecicum HHB10207 ss-3]